MPHSTEQPPRHWWQTATVYQIYPASFKDSNADGYGDIPGIISKVDHIASLGVDAVWLSPAYKSPQIDFGYDIADYRQIDERYGSLADMELLIAKLKEHNIKLIMDLVVNHTSDQHPWFEESRSSVHSPKRDWYIWRKGRIEEDVHGNIAREPPNNWASEFKGSAWQYDEATDEWYLCLFSHAQPDLNWENAELRHAVYDDMRFWLEKGIGGFRMDVINMISKPEGLPNMPAATEKAHLKYQKATELYCNGPHIHEYLQEMRREVLDQYPDIMTVGEVPHTFDPEPIRNYVKPERKELNMVFQFDLFNIDHGNGEKFVKATHTIEDFKRTIAKWQQALSYSSGAWQTVFLESHDAARSVSRFGDRTPENRFKFARMLAMLETTLSGTLFLHQGQEIGMVNLADDIPVERYLDIETKGFLNDIRDQKLAAIAITPGANIEMDETYEQVRLKARDHGRMPLPWEAGKRHAGFSDADENRPLWTLKNTDQEACNVSQQNKTPDSVLKFWRNMLRFRKRYAETVVYGDFEPLQVDDGPIFAYRRITLQETEKPLVVVLNMKAEKTTFELPDGGEGTFTLVQQTTSLRASRHSIGGQAQVGDMIQLDAYEGLVYEY